MAYYARHLQYFKVTCMVLLLQIYLAFSLIPFAEFRFAPNDVCVYPRYLYTETQKFTLRNVPGQGDCMFLAVALATLTSMGMGGNQRLLQAIANETRDITASIMESDGNVVIEGTRIVATKRLLQSAAANEGMTPSKYIQLLRKSGNAGGLYGGGPELTILSNILRRPISIYEMANHSIKEAQAIKCVGTFGQDFFKDPLLNVPQSAVLSSALLGAYSWHLHILVVDVSEHEKHACVLLPH